MRKQNGKILNWALYRVHLTGSTDEYNYAAISYYDSFAKVEPNDNYLELMKASNPKADAAAILAKTLTLRTITRQFINSRIDATTPKAGAPAAKYFHIGFMKAKPGMDAEYVRLEREEWKVVHQAMVDDGKMLGWSFWGLELPGGSSSLYDYATASNYSSFDQMGNLDYGAAVKKAFPNADPQLMYDRALKSRNMVKSELWELILTTN